MLPESTAEAICLHYNLGEPTAAPGSITGGFIHRLYRLETTGTFAVKRLNPDIMRYENIYDNLRRSEAIAAEFASAGVPAVLALDAPGGTVQDFDNTAVIVYPWCDGSVLPKSAASPEEAFQIGAILGRMHALDLPSEAPPEPPVCEPMAQEPWTALMRRGQEQQTEWVSAVEAALPDLFAWDRDRIAANAALPQTLVLSHCDLDQKNVIWQSSHTPLLIDWESAGPTSPGAEIIAAALDWSGQNAGPPNPAAFKAVLAGYGQEMDFDADLALPLMRSRLGGWIDWVAASMNRSLDSKATSAERAAGTRETLGTLTTMYALADSMEHWAKWCD